MLLLYTSTPPPLYTSRSTTDPQLTLSSNSELAREKMWSRIHLIPMLAAEEDRDQVRRHFADKARERELLGAETKVYHSDRYCFSLLSLEKPQTMAHKANDTNTVSFARHSLLLLMRLPSRFERKKDG
jgi:hypothetical protein